MARAKQARSAKGANRATPGDNPPMALRLFRTTGYSTLLMPGETRVATHPSLLILWASLWLALACNVALWRFLGGDIASWRAVLVSALWIAGAAGVVFSLLGWRRTLKPAVTVALIAGALVACGMWVQKLPVEMIWQGPPRRLLPSWADFMRWQVLALTLVLAVLPIVWVWHAQVRRLPGPAQLRVNLAGACIAAVVFAAGWLLPA